MNELEGKVAAVTGAASGIGRAMAERWAGAGMAVALADIEAEPLERAASELADQGATVSSMVVDVADGDQVEGFAEATRAAHGAVHVLCNNAGVGHGGPLWTLTTADWEWVLGVNLWGVIHGIRAFVPQMVEQGEGHVVNTASVAGLVSAPMLGPYSASKYAVVSISETLQTELGAMDGDFGVTAVCPGWVRTRIAESERNRPDHLRNEGQEPVEGPASGSLLETGVDPADLAAQVEEAVRGKHLYVLTHDDWTPMLRDRMDQFTAGSEALPFGGSGLAG